MTRADQQHPYLAALDKAHAELEEILSGYRQLQIRKERLEEAAEALQVFLRAEKQRTVEAQRTTDGAVERRSARLEPVPFPPEKVVESSPVPAIQNESRDPIQRRINDALGIAAVA